MNSTWNVKQLARRRRREQGAALLVAMMVLALVSALAITALESVMNDQRIAGFQARKRIAFQAAEAGVAAARASIVTGGGIPDLQLTQLGDVVIYPLGQPTYGPDTTVAQPVTDLGAQAAPGMNLRIDGNGAPKYQIRLWRFRVEGREPNGIVSRLETTASSFKGN